MDTSDRRNFLKLIGSSAIAAALPLDLSKVLAIQANNRTGTIADVEHIVILMQENRSFDHYFGTMRGVRGFADPRAVTLPSGKSVWAQPNGSGVLLPYRPDVQDLGMTFLPDPPHGWNDTHAAWNGGRYDRWVPNKGVETMTYHTRKDLPYQYALADAFTICDNYHCSLMGPTDPNRYHMWTGWVGNDGAGGGPGHHQRRGRLRLVHLSRAPRARRHQAGRCTRTLASAWTRPVSGAGPTTPTSATTATTRSSTFTSISLRSTERRWPSARGPAPTSWRTTVSRAG